MRYWVSVGIVALLAAAGIAVDKKVDPAPKPEKAKPRVNPTPERLSGTWELTHLDNKPVPEWKLTESLTKDGKVTITSTRRRNPVRTGTYKLDGDVLLIVLTTGVDDDERESSGTIIELTAERLVVVPSPELGWSRAVYKRVPDGK